MTYRDHVRLGPRRVWRTAGDPGHARPRSKRSCPASRADRARRRAAASPRARQETDVRAVVAFAAASASEDRPAPTPIPPEIEVA